MLTPERWRRVQQVLDRALELPGDRRLPFLADECRGDRELQTQVEALLRTAEVPPEAFLDRPLLRLGSEAPLLGSESRLGPYRLQRLLGRGGMGEVHLAVRADDTYRKQVAIKLLQPGLASSAEIARRFHGERQILANLEHPGIARLLDGGTAADGRPFLVMEYVKGEPIDHYCAQCALGVEDRLYLFHQVCEAVQYAHQNLVVHRDLKPGNILISPEGRAKLLDFGIAKLLEPEGFQHTVLPTATGSLAMTPEYASPEQVSGGAITTASDVYSLGVLLYELLTGRRPYRLRRLDPKEIFEKVCQARPPRPSVALAGGAAEPDETVRRPPPGEISKLRRRLRGDLDNIVLRALRKEPRERYSSAAELASDLDLHLRGLPVRARPDTFGYRAAKFIARHRLGLSAAAAAFAILILLSVSLWIQRGVALRQQQRTERTVAFLEELLGATAPDQTRGSIPTLQEVLERGVRRIEHRLADDPAEKADLLETMGRTYMNLGLNDQAEPLLLSSLELRRRALGRTHPEVTRSLLHLAELRGFQARYPEAERLLDEVLRMRAPGARDSLAAETLMQRGMIRFLAGDLQEAEADLERALEASRRLGMAEPLGGVLQNLGRLLEKLDRLDEAEARFQEALAIYREHYGSPHPKTAYLLNNLGLVAEKSGDYPGARARYEEARAMQRQLFPQGHADLATTLFNLGVLSNLEGDSPSATSLLREAHEMYRELLGEEHPKVAHALGQLARIEQDRGDLDSAEPKFRRALAIRLGSIGEEHPDTARSLRQLAQLKVDRGDYEEAERLYRRALEIQQRILGPENPDAAVTQNNLGELARLRGDYPEAVRLHGEALDRMRRSLGTVHAEVAMTQHNLAIAHHYSGELAAAGRNYREALAAARPALGEEHPKVGVILLGLFAVSRDLGALEEAAGLGLAAVEIFGEALPAHHPWRVEALAQTGLCLLAEKRYDEAEPLLLEAHASRLETDGSTSDRVRRLALALATLYEARGRPEEAARFRPPSTETQ